MEVVVVSDEVIYVRACDLVAANAAALEVPADMRHQVLRRLGWDDGQRFIEDALKIAEMMLIALGDRWITQDTVGAICQTASLVATDNYNARLHQADLPPDETA